MRIVILDDVLDFLKSLSREEDAKIMAHLKSLELNQTEGLIIKPLKRKVKELIVKQNRIVFFRIGDTGYVVDAFKKQSKKTPERIIERAEKIYRSIDEK